MNVLRQLWRSHPLACIGFLAGLSLTLVFLARLALFTFYWSDPAHRAPRPEGWMTPGYVAHSWQLPVEEVAAQLGLTPRRPKGKPPTLSEIARASGEDEAALLARLEAWLDSRRAEGMPER
ncbi:hypothetical protein SAMN06297129_2631 [Pseudooceanicola antarcticus]|uniref:Uncharacterized protein n=1 Tax=Pseudooceanicola antarcticus TaxID=1247613 RepID=A0A285J359_9RHOB|nr:hypothetical protein [Pseudooceanicola antarcticus]PJE29946.1 hypothetical protein CVM39_08630 [Pseudooceanicola antarcticus]SNY53796.1 hypothetical protein SAMN06297129_2631 [Pseudooceanicola antarcticus]